MLAFRGPTGRSLVPKEPDTELILLATGVGVSPFWSLTSHLLAQGFDRPIRLWWGLSFTDDVCLTVELDELGRDHPNFSYQVSLSQPPDDWRGLRGRLTESVPPLLSTLAGKHYYLCGNGAMIEELGSVLTDHLGVDPRLVHEERFLNAGHRADPASVAAIRGRIVAPCLSPLLLGGPAQLSTGWDAG